MARACRAFLARLAYVFLVRLASVVFVFACFDSIAVRVDVFMEHAVSCVCFVVFVSKAYYVSPARSVVVGVVVAASLVAAECVMGCNGYAGFARWICLWYVRCACLGVDVLWCLALAMVFRCADASHIPAS